MALNIEQSWRHLFHDQVILTFQQLQSVVKNRLLPKYIHNGATAAKDYFDRMGNVVANQVISPFGQTKTLNPDYSRRATTLQSYDGAVLVSDEYTLRSMINPTNEYRETIVGALVRAADKNILDAAIGSAETSTVNVAGGALSSSTTALPSGQKITGGAAITLANIISANSKLSKGGVPNGEGERLFFYSPGQLQDIMAITQASSSDFTKNQIHDRGTINGLMWQGFNWIEVQDPVAPDLTVLNNMLQLASTTRSCIAMYRGAVGLSIAQEIETKINERPDLNNCVQVRCVMKLQAVRLFEGAVVQLDVLEN